MADGEIRIKVSVDGKDVEATVSGLNNMTKSSEKAAGGIKDIVTSLGMVKIASAAINVLKNSLDDAIKRFDTIERYPKVMESLGHGADLSRESIEKLQKGIEGLPTTLNSVVASTQKMATITGQLGKSTDAVLALNNSFMANGASVSDAERGMIQYLQMLSKGTVDIVSWRTLQETMGVALKKTAEAMGYVGTNGVNKLYSALQSGKATFAEFQDNLINIATGTGEIAVLAQQNSKGIETSFSNLRVSVVRNVADMVKVFDSLAKEVTGKSIADNIDSMKGGIDKSFKSINSTVKKTTPVFKTFADVVKATISVTKTLEPALVGVATAYVALKVIQGVNGHVRKSHELLSLARESMKGLTVSVNLYTAAKGKETVAEGASTTSKTANIAAQAAQNGVVGLGTAAVGLLTGALSVHEAATIASTAAIGALNTAMSFLGGPVGIVVASIGVLATGLMVHKTTSDKAASSTNDLVAATEKLIEKTSEATKHIEDSISARKTEVEDIEASTDAYNALSDELDELIKSEKKSGTEKARIQTIVDSLNGSLGGLGLAYDKENDSLSIGTGLLKDRIKVLQANEKAESARKNVIQINKEIQATEKSLGVLIDDRNKKEKEFSEQYEKNAMRFARHDISMAESSASHTKSLDLLNGKIKEQEGNLESLQAQKLESDNAIISSQALVDEAIANGVMSQQMSYEQLSESQKTAVDSMNAKWNEYREQATNMFDTLSDEQTMSVQQMITNLEENQRVMSQWADNIAILAERGVNQGLLDRLRDAGPESAGHVAALVSASDEQLQQLNTSFDSGGKTATDSLKKAFDFEGSGINETITGFITKIPASMKEQLAIADFASITSNVGIDLANGIKANGEAVLSSSKELGGYIPQGASQGIDANAGVVQDSVTRLTENIKTGFSTPLGIQSPSTVFIQYGRDILEGLKGGIEGSKETAISAMRIVATTLPTVFDGSSSEFYQIGNYLMQGLANGINDNAGVAIAAAESVAASVKAVTQNAYDENSPSRWMKDFIGKYLMYGLADGLHKYMSAPVDAMQTASEYIKVPMITAEAAIGSGFTSGNYYASNKNYYQTNNDNRELASAIKKLANRPIIVSTEVDSKQIAKTTALPMSNEIQKNETFMKMLRGERS